MRATNAVERRRNVKRIRRKTRGYFGGGRTQLRQSRTMLARAMRFAWFHRFLRKRDFRRLWITRISAACRNNGISYSRFIAALNKANIQLNRKSLSEIAIRDPQGFTAIVKQVTAAK